MLGAGVHAVAQGARQRRRLREVVVRASVQTCDPVVDRVARREHEDGRPGSALPETPAHGEPVRARQHHIEHDHLVLGGGRHPRRVVAGACDVYGKPFLGETAPKEAGHLHVVLDDEHPHGLIVRPEDEREMKSVQPVLRLALSWLRAVCVVRPVVA